MCVCALAWKCEEIAAPCVRSSFGFGESAATIASLLVRTMSPSAGENIRKRSELIPTLEQEVQSSDDARGNDHPLRPECLMPLTPVQRIERLHFVAAALERTDRDRFSSPEESLPRAFPPSRGSSCRGCSSSRRYSRSGKLRSACSRSDRAPWPRKKGSGSVFPALPK